MTEDKKKEEVRMVLTPRMTLPNKKKIYFALQKRKKYLTKLLKKNESINTNLRRLENNLSLRAPEKFKIFQEHFKYLLELNELETKRTNCLISRGQKISKLKKSTQILNSFNSQLEEMQPERVLEKIKLNKERCKTLHEKTLNEQNIPKKINEEIKILKEEFSELDYKKKSEHALIQRKYQKKKFIIDKIEKKKQKILQSIGQGGSNIFQLEEKAEVLLDHLKKAKTKVKELEKLRSFSDRNTPSKDEISTENKQNKGQWVAKLMKDHPHLLFLRERLRPSTKQKSFSMLTSHSKTPTPTLLSKNVINQLIMKHFEIEGKPQIRKFIEFTTATNYIPSKSRISPVFALLLLSLRNGSKLWDLSVDELSSNIDLPNLEVDELRNTQDKATVRGLEEDENEIDVNIWNQIQDNNNNIIYSNNSNNDNNQRQSDLFKSIQYANINKLIENATPITKSRDIKYIDIILITYPKWITPEKLFFKLIQRFEVPIPTKFKNKEEEEKYQTMVNVVQKNVLLFLQDWIEKSFSDLSTQLLAMIKNFIVTKVKNNYRSRSKKLLLKILRLERKNEGLKSKLENPPDPIFPKNIFSPKLELSQVDVIEYARQLTLIRFSIFKNCRASELVTQAWSKERLKHKAKNILTMISYFNKISLNISNQIIDPLKLKDRVKKMTRFLKIGQHFRKINNYDGIMMIIAGLRESSVNRLKFTKGELPSQPQNIFDELLELTDSLQNYSVLKDAIKNAPKPCLPHIGMYLTDLTFIFDGHPDKVDGLINFTKLKLIYNVISQIEACKIKEYNFYPIYQIQKLFYEIEHPDKNELYNKSLEREPRKVKRQEII
ncbi:ras guanine nucleotide exchange factor i-related [Anaeramoeba flamelloides]|uniref:Ras guanine nucleotide exchange factor i-related n=1 Tax=Anaeramoeba flamelloides TaxID=1746091 RepID=A0AAV7YT06_9EUKA|nr:ras guanine nucleotide exchange factor i-related [Anaeramoeba flamelloides]